MVTSSAVVGSSAISRSGSLASAMAIIDALALPAGQLMRIGVEPLLGLGNADLAQQLEHALAHGCAVEAADAARSTSPTCCSMVCSGLSEVIGSWKIMDDVVAADPAACLGAAA